MGVGRWVAHFHTSARPYLHTLLFVLAATGVAAQPLPPTGLETRDGDRSVILRWQRSPTASVYYRVYRAPAAGGEPAEVGLAAGDERHFLDFDVENDSAYVYTVRAERAGTPSEPSEAAIAYPRALTDDEFLDLVARTSFDYFWHEANGANGLVRDRTGGGIASVAAIGFGLTAYGVGVERGWISREQGRARTLNTLRFLWNAPQGAQATGVTGHRGFFYHFLDMTTGHRAGTTELSTVDTALLMTGVLYARAFFDGPDAEEAEVRALADSIYRRVDWVWAQARPPSISHGWRPEGGFLPFDWIGYSEAMLVYLLALGSPTYPVGPQAWTTWTSGYRWATHYGFSFIEFPPLFGHQYTHVWYDFRGIRDAYGRTRGLDYAENSRRATLANRAYALANPRGWPNYGPDEWGLTASDDPDVGYQAHGAPPALNDNGTIAPTAAGASYPFTPVESLEALRGMYAARRTTLWGPYGFRDAYNAAQGWTAQATLGIDQGPLVLMIENGRTGHVWQRFMALPEVQAGLDRAGFEPFPIDAESAPTADLLALSAAPNPTQGRASVSFFLPAASEARLVAYDALGREVAVLVNGPRAAGAHTAEFNTAALPGGLYLLRLDAAGAARTARLVVLP